MAVNRGLPITIGSDFHVEFGGSGCLLTSAMLGMCLTLIESKLSQVRLIFTVLFSFQNVWFIMKSIICRVGPIDAPERSHGAQFCHPIDLYYFFQVMCEFLLVTVAHSAGGEVLYNV
jgi:hypothetical protein